jgi:hypothetical protein
MLLEQGYARRARLCYKNKDLLGEQGCVTRTSVNRKKNRAEL